MLTTTNFRSSDISKTFLVAMILLVSVVTQPLRADEPNALAAHPENTWIKRTPFKP